MGGGSYSGADWARLKTSKKIDSGDVNSLFVSRGAREKYDPRFISFRESRDSAEHPRATPIMVGVDVTGSMGYLSEYIVKTALNELMQMLYSTRAVEDPQLLFAAVGDVLDNAPLQVTQFESDIRIAEQLLELWIEGGGGDTPEDYQLMWYFAARHTDIDSYKNRKEKGFCFTVGDAPCHPTLSRKSIEKIFGKNEPLPPGDLTAREIAEAAGEKYHLFHINIGSTLNGFDQILPGRVISIRRGEEEYLPQIIISVMLLVRGQSRETVLGLWNEIERNVVEGALKYLNIKTGNALKF